MNKTLYLIPGLLALALAYVILRNFLKWPLTKCWPFWMIFYMACIFASVNWLLTGLLHNYV